MWPKPSPDWGRKGTQPKGSAGPKPRPNGRVVATKPIFDIEALDACAIPVRRQIAATMSDLDSEREAWLREARQAGHEVVMVMYGVNAIHYQARPLRPEDV